MLLVFGLVACLAAQPSVGVLPSVPSVTNPAEERDNRHARRRDAKRDGVYKGQVRGGGRGIS